MNSSTPLILAETIIRQDEFGRFCLNDLHRAAGENSKHQPSNWLRLQQTIDLIEEVSIPQIRGIESKQGLGTFAIKELVYAYAMWISPKFHIEVIRAYDAQVTQTPNFAYSRALNLDEQAVSRLKSYLTVGDLFEVPKHVMQQEAANRVYVELGVDYRPLLLLAPAQQVVTHEEKMLEPKPLAARLGMKSAQAFNTWLAELGWQTKESGSWAATDLGKPHCTDHTWTLGSKSGYNLRWNVSTIEGLFKVNPPQPKKLLGTTFV